MGNSLHTQLYESINNADYEKFNNIIKNLPDGYNIDNLSEYSILHGIIKKYYTDPENRLVYAKMFMDSIKKGANINSFDMNGNTLLINSIVENDYNIAKFLIKNGANPNIPNKKNYKTPLVYASQLGIVPFVILLLKQKNIIIQPVSISLSKNDEIKKLIITKIDQINLDKKIEKIQNNINFKSNSYTINLLDEILEKEK
jgi:ankyrin repeat protein